MSLEQIRQKIKSFWQGGGFDTVGVILVVILGVFCAFGLGLINQMGKSPEIKMVAGLDIDFDKVLAQPSQTDQKGTIVASKSGTRYYYLHCSGVNRIKDENKVYFSSPTEAEAKGLTIASGCAKP